MAKTTFNSVIEKCFFTNETTFIKDKKEIARQQGQFKWGRKGGGELKLFNQK